MTIRKQVSYIHNRWYDGQRVDQVDMTVEQDRNVSKDASIIQNHFGSGVLPSASIQKVLFDTDNLFPDQVALIASNDFDGTGLRPLAQPTDLSLGNQFEVELTDSDPDLNGPSTVGGRLSTKVLVIGLDFQGNLQYDRFYFYRKEKQVTKKHYAQILTVFFNDFYGNNNCSRQLGGRVIIRETESFQLSRDGLMIAQDVEPNLFFRDFKVSNTTIGANPTVTLFQTIQAGIGPEYGVDSLHINTTVKRDFELVADDVTTRIAEKFLAKTNNIQKITILLGVRKDLDAGLADQFNWSGELIVSIFELQSTISCPTDLVPELAIEFDPKPVPLTQFSLDQETLRDQGYILTNVLQPIDLVFNNSRLGNTANPVIVPGKHYAFSIGRAGDASIGILFTGIGNSQTTDDRFSIFTSEWTDVPEEDMWYQVWSDTAKVSDGLAYDAGNGMEIPKTKANELGAVVDYAFDQNPFANSGQNTLNTAVVEAIREQSVQEQDERTGNPVFARQRFEPNFSFVTNTTLAELRESSEPLVIGCARDANAKSNNIITGLQEFPGLAKGNIFTIINPDADLLSQQLVGSKLIPSDDCAGLDYKIVKVRICTDGYGDVNGDGQIDEDDVFRATQLLNQSLELPSTQEMIRNGYIDTLELIRADVDGDGYITSNDVDLISNYVSRNINSFPVGSSFQHVELEVQNSTGRFDGYYDCDGYVRLDGYIGSNIIDPADLSDVELQYYGFNSIPSIDGNDPVFNIVPFVPTTFVVRPVPFWQDYLLQFSSEARFVPATFTFTEDSDEFFDENGQCLSPDFTTCRDSAAFGGTCNPGRNDFFVPDNLIIGKGQILSRDGTFFKQDIEIQTITLELPKEKIFQHAVVNIFEKLIKDNGDGFTSAGFPAMKFANCSTVQADALLRNQLRFSVAIQSLYPALDGHDEDGYGIIIDDIIGVNIDQSTGIMTLTVRDLEHDLVYSELRTKIIITVYLKKAGWNNIPLVIPFDQVAGLFVIGVSDP
jgi:hypothetical protein